MKIYSINGEEVHDLQLNESTTLTRRLMVENTVTLVYNSTTAVALSVGDYFDFQYRWGDAPEQQVNERYTLNEPPSVKVDDRGIYSYSALFVGHLHMLDSRMIDTENDNVDYYFFGTPTAHLDFIMSKINGDTTEYSYSINEDVGGEPKNINYASMSLLSALHKFCEEYKCEFDLLGKRFSFAKKVENETAITFEIGKGKGLYSIHQGKLANEKIATVVYPFGGTTNMVNGKRLAIPERKVERGVETYGVRENRMVFEDIFPERSGAITTDATRKESGSAYWKVTDASLDFDLEQQLLEDAVIEFTSGDCTGVQFKIVSYEHASRTIVFMEKVEEESDTKRGVLPNEQRTPKRGDSYHFLNIVMPDSYVVEAQKRLREAAAAELERVAVPQVSYTVEVDSRFLKTQEWRPSNGDVVNVVNQELNYEIKIRIIGISFPLCAPDKIKLTLSENILTSAAQSMLTSIRKDIQTAVKANRFHPMGGNFSTPLVAEKLVANTIHSRHFSGSGFEQSGWSIGAHPDFSGQTLAVVDYLSVRKAINVHEIVANQVKYMGGKMIFSAAAIEIIQQEELPQSRQWKVTFETHEGKQSNQFVVNDLVLCQQFDAKNRQTKRYHWIVDGVGTDYLILRLGIMSDGVPEVGDLLVQYGHLTNAQRQHAYVIDTIGGARTTLLGGLNYAGAGGKVVAELGFVDGRPKFFVGNENSFINYDPSDASSQLKIKAAVEFSSNSTGLDKLPQWKEIEKQMDNVNIPQVQVRTSADVVTSGKGFSPATISAQRVLKVGDREEVLENLAIDAPNIHVTSVESLNNFGIYLGKIKAKAPGKTALIRCKVKYYKVSQDKNSGEGNFVVQNPVTEYAGQLATLSSTPNMDEKVVYFQKIVKFSSYIWGDSSAGNVTVGALYDMNIRLDNVTIHPDGYINVTDIQVMDNPIEYAGRNIVKGTSTGSFHPDHGQVLHFGNNEYSWSNTSLAENFISSPSLTIPTLAGRKLHLSFYAKKTANCRDLDCFIIQEDGYKVAWVAYNFKPNGYQQYKFSFTIPNTITKPCFIRFDNNRSVDGLEATVWIKDIMLSLDDTPYSPAPEDATFQLNGAPYTPNTEVPSGSADSFTFTSDWNGQSDSRTVVVTPGTSLDYLKEAFQGTTKIQGGVVQSSVALFEDMGDGNKVKSYINGNASANTTAFAAGVTDFGTPQERKIIDLKHEGEGSKIGVFHINSNNVSVDNEETGGSISISNERIENIVRSPYSRTVNLPSEVYNYSDKTVDTVNNDYYEWFWPCQDSSVRERQISFNIPSTGVYQVDVNSELLSYSYASCKSLISASREIESLKSKIQIVFNVYCKIELEIYNNGVLMSSWNKLHNHQYNDEQDISSQFKTNLAGEVILPAKNVSSPLRCKYSATFNAGTITVKKRITPYSVYWRVFGTLQGAGSDFLRLDNYLDLLVTSKVFNATVKSTSELSVISTNGHYIGVDADNEYKNYFKDGKVYLGFKGIVLPQSNVPYLLAGGIVHPNKSITNKSGKIAIDVDLAGGNGYKVWHKLDTLNYQVTCTAIANNTTTFVACSVSEIHKNYFVVSTCKMSANQMFWERHKVSFTIFGSLE